MSRKAIAFVLAAATLTAACTGSTPTDPAAARGEPAVPLRSDGPSPPPPPPDTTSLCGGMLGSGTVVC